jgi:anthranilate phosphoribosyltransferase
VHDAVVLNAGAALAAHSGFARGGFDTDEALVAALRDGVERARAAIASGAAATALERWVSYSGRRRAAQR